jgi:hypothetical protein
MITTKPLIPRCVVCRNPMHKKLSGEYECRRVACGVPAKRPRAKRPGPPRRVSVLRNREYLDWLKERKCVACLRAGTLCENPVMDPAHGPSAGARVKGPDNEAIPLCRYHHREQHNIGWPDFEARYRFSREKEAAAHYAVWLLVKGE